jgi:hypothetical protein
VAGGASCSPQESAEAREVGRLLAKAGIAVVTGGLGGVMEAASQGAREGGGTTVAILPGADRADANPFVDIAVPTGLGDARNAVVAASGDAMIAVGGGLGTLSEIALALQRGIPVVGLHTWKLDPRRLPPGAGIREADTPEAAVRMVAEALHDRMPR